MINAVLDLQPSEPPPADRPPRHDGPALGQFVHITRFDRATRLLHIVVMVSFLGLSATGMPLLFSDAGWARLLASLFGGFRGAGLVHRMFGGILLGAVAWHLGNIAYRAMVRHEKGLFWGPTSMVPQPRDFVDLYGNVKWFFGLGPRPRFEHFAYWEKFDYWAVLWHGVDGRRRTRAMVSGCGLAYPARLDVQCRAVRPRC